MTLQRGWCLVAVGFLAAFSAGAQTVKMKAAGAGMAVGAAAPGAAEGVAGAVVRIREITGIGGRSLVRTPEYTTTFPRGRVPAREWALINLTFDTEPVLIEDLTIRYYALMHSRQTKDYTLLTGTVVHPEVMRGRNHQSAMLVRPAHLEVYGEVVGVAAEVMTAGRVVTSLSDEKGQLPKEWWTNPKLTVKDGALLSRAQTPFAFVNYDDYEPVR